MNKDEQTKALAELGGYTERKGVMEYDGAYMPWTIMERDGNEYNSTDKRFDYLTSHDAIIPVIEKQSRGIQLAFISHLREFLKHSPDEDYLIGWMLPVILATPQQLSKSLLRATGKWKETK